MASYGRKYDEKKIFQMALGCVQKLWRLLWVSQNTWDNLKKIEKKWIFYNFLKLFSFTFTWIWVDFGRYQTSKLIFSIRNHFKQNVLNRKFHYDTNELNLSYLGRSFHLEKAFRFENLHKFAFSKAQSIL